MSEKRQQIEAAATEAVQKKGFNSLSFRTLGDKVGVKSSSIHYYFPEKSDLACALITRYSQGFLSLLENINTNHKTLTEKFDTFVNIFDDTVKSNKFCLCGMMAAEIDSLDDASRTALKEYFQNGENWIFDNLTAHSDEVISDLPKTTLAKIIFSGLEGAILIDRADCSSENLAAQKKLIKSFLK